MLSCGVLLLYGLHVTEIEELKNVLKVPNMSFCMNQVSYHTRYRGITEAEHPYHTMRSVNGTPQLSQTVCFTTANTRVLGYSNATNLWYSITPTEGVLTAQAQVSLAAHARAASGHYAYGLHPACLLHAHTSSAAQAEPR